MNIALALNLFTRTPGWAIAHRENTSMLNPNPPRVRSDRVNSTTSAPMRCVAVLARYGG
jgi:hypothetical protein